MDRLQLLVLASCCSLMMVNVVRSTVQCIGDKKQLVDWFVVYKLPRVNLKEHDFFKEGTGMAYMDSQSSSWKFLGKSIGDADQPVAYTFNQMYDKVKSKNTKSLAYLLYNDDTPTHSKMSSSKAHAKGGLCFDKTSGFWLAHTIPRFPPPAKDGYSYPKSGTKFGQVLLCVSFYDTQLNSIALQMNYMNPQVYEAYITPDFMNTSFKMYKFIMENAKHKITKKN